MRGFETASQPNSEIIQEFVDHPILSSVASDKANTLTLLCLNDFDSFRLGCSSAAKTPPCFLFDPYRPVHTEEVDNPIVYAQLLGKLSLKEWNHCGTGMSLLQQPGTFQVHNDGPIGISKGYPKCQFIVSQVSIRGCMGIPSWDQDWIHNSESCRFNVYCMDPETRS